MADVVDELKAEIAKWEDHHLEWNHWDKVNDDIIERLKAEIAKLKGAARG